MTEFEKEIRKMMVAKITSKISADVEKVEIMRDWARKNVEAGTTEYADRSYEQGIFDAIEFIFEARKGRRRKTSK